MHPDDYGFARKMAADALEQDEDDADEQILRVIGRPKKLEDIGMGLRLFSFFFFVYFI